MSRSTRPSLWPLSRGGALVLVPSLALASGLSLALASATVPVVTVFAQGGRTDPAALRVQLERRFDLLPVRGGVVLRPRTASSGVRSIEIVGGTIAVDGQAVTGAELRSRLPADADMLLQLSYLDDTQRQVVLGATTEPAPGVAATSPSADVPQTPAPPPPPAVSETPAPPATASPSTDDPDDPPRRSGRRRNRGGDIVRFGGTVNVAEGETIPGDVVVIGGSARVHGTVNGELVVVGGSLELGPKADVDGDVVVVGGAIRRDPGARVGGELQEVGVGPININWDGPGRELRDWWRGGPFGRTFSLVSTLVRVGVVCLLAALVMLLSRDYTERIAGRAVAEPFKAGAVGLLAQVLFVPVLVVTCILLVVTVIGWPLLLLIPFAILGLVVLALVGFSAVATHLGRLVTARFGWTEYGPIATTAIGVLVVTAPVIVGRVVGLAGGPFWFLATALVGVGLLVEYLAWTVGMGAVALARFSRGYTSGGVVTGPIGPTPSGPLGPPAPDSPSPA